jgi:Holliday junction resolvase RusA-like endonuclease
VTRLVIKGPPRTKKTSNRVLRFGRFNKVVPSEAWCAFRDLAVPQLTRQLEEIDAYTISTPITVNAQIYRDARRGDLVGYLTSIADVLEEAAVVSDDVVIESWDGSRMCLDRENPRIEIEISDLSDEDLEISKRKLPVARKGC